MVNEKEEIFIAPFKDTKWLCISSLFFTFPSYYAYINNLYLHSLLLLTATLISVNFWRKATYSWRRNIDLMFAKLAFAIFFTEGVYHINSVNYLISGYISLFALAYCFHLSVSLQKINNNNWYKYHFLFHIFSTYEQFIVIDSIIKNRKRLTNFT